MTMPISGAAGPRHAAHARPLNFGQLNSAIARGDLAAAQASFTALTESNAPAAMGVKARGSLEALGAAIISGDVEAARKSLADFRAGRTTEATAVSGAVEAATTAPAPAPETAMAQPPPAPSTTEQIVTLLSGTGATIAVSA